MSGWTKLPLLEVGELVRVVRGGTVYRVVRVSPSAAYLKPRTGSGGKLVEIPGRAPFVAHEEGGILAISPRAAVYREGRVEEGPVPDEALPILSAEAGVVLKTWLDLERNPNPEISTKIHAGGQITEEILRKAREGR